MTAPALLEQPTPTTLDSPSLDAALSYAARGWRVVPIGAGTKWPDLGDWVNAATTDEDTIRWWYADRPDRGVGIATGPASSMFVLDVDTAHGKAGGDTLAELEAAHGALPDTVESITGSGGRHLLFKFPAGMDLNNSAGRLGPDLDIRAAGGQIVAPPTRHPETGQPYAWNVEHHPDDTEVADAPQWLLDLLRETERTERAEGPRPVYEQATLAKDRFNLHPQADDHVAQLLTSVGWDEGRPGRDGVRYFTRPGKTGGISASLNKVAPGVLRCFTSSAPPLEAERSYDPFDVLALLRHSGDRQAADRELHGLGWGLSLFGLGLPDLGDARPSEHRRPHLWLASSVTETEIDESWLPVALAQIAADGYAPPVPTILRTADGVDAYFYAGSVNGIHGDSGIGKSWLAHATVAQALTAGRRAIVLDFESSAPEVFGRLRAMAVDADRIIHGLTYIAPSASVTDAAIDSVIELIHHDTEVIVIDSLGEAFGIDGIDENSDAEVAPWLRRVPRRLADAGPAVILIDHATKAADNPLHPSGSKRKRAAITGASYLVRAIRTPTRDAAGALALDCAKDRHGTYARASTVANVDITPYPDGGVTVNLHRPVQAEGQAEVAVELCAQAACRALADEGRELPQRALVELMRQHVKAATDTVRAGIELAIARGHIDVEPGARGARLHRLADAWNDRESIAPDLSRSGPGEVPNPAG